MDMFKLDKSPQQWETIHQEMQESGWEDFTLERTGDLTVWLTHNNLDEYRENWNRIASEVRPTIRGHISKLSETQSINDDLASYLVWDLIHLYVEEYFCKLEGAPCFYIEHTLDLYKNNRIPCGWEGDYPEGRIKSV